MNSRVNPLHLDSRQLLECLQHQSATVLALVSQDGTLLDGNKGLRRLLARRSNPASNDLTGFFVQPRLEQLNATVADAQGCVHHGMITLGDAAASCVSLIGTVHRQGTTLLLVAEFDVAEMEMVNATVIQLNDAMTHMQRELARQQRHLEDLVEARTASLLLAKEAAEAANLAKSSFLATMSHELRTPMNVIMGMTELALQRSSDSTQQGQLGRVRQSANRLLASINGILDIANMEAGRLQLQAIDFDLDSVLDKLRGLLGDQAARKGLALSLSAQPGLGQLPLVGDPLRLGQVLINLLENAIKFTEHGSVRLHLAREGNSSTSVMLRAEVHDTGIGIAEEDRQHIFSQFQQVDGSSTRKYSGIGLGLAICKQLVHMMGGDIGVTGVPGGGSTFWFTAKLLLQPASSMTDTPAHVAADGLPPRAA